jgi:hypothetical protein
LVKIVLAAFREEDMTRYLLILLATMWCAHAAAKTRIDASSDDTFNTSLHSMKQELEPEKQAQLDTALMSLPFAGMQSLKDTPPDGVVRLDIKALDGMTADQIIELERKTVTVKIRVGPPPGLPDKFKTTLRPGTGMPSNGPETFSLAGTQWVVTDNMNGHASEMRLKLLADGKVDDGVSTAGRWEQVGAKVRIALNDNTYEGSPSSLGEPAVAWKEVSSRMPHDGHS